jgi:hypothetical protein
VTMMRPPGRSTRRNSANTEATSSTCESTRKHVSRSNVELRNGMARTSATMSPCDPPRCSDAVASIPRLTSIPYTSWPRMRKRPTYRPVPAPTSRADPAAIPPRTAVTKGVSFRPQKRCQHQRDCDRRRRHHRRPVDSRLAAITHAPPRMMRVIVDEAQGVLTAADRRRTPRGRVRAHRDARRRLAGGPTALADSGSGVSSISTGASSTNAGGALGGADVASGQVRTTATTRIACNAADIATLVRTLHATRFARSRLPSGEMRRIRSTPAQIRVT